jgi:hypothetical protein
MPLAVVRIWTRRASRASCSICTKPLRFKPATTRLMVGGFTCSAAASRPSVVGPPNTSTDKAESRAGPSPVAVSCLRTRRSKWIATEWRRSATSRVSLSVRALLVRLR